MKLANAIKKLEKNGYEVSSELGSYIAQKGMVTISFFENQLGSGECGRFTYEHEKSCSPTYGLSLKSAIG